MKFRIPFVVIFLVIYLVILTIVPPEFPIQTGFDAVPQILLALGFTIPIYMVVNENNNQPEKEKEYD
jgi:hypothetical protein